MRYFNLSNKVICSFGRELVFLHAVVCNFGKLFWWMIGVGVEV